MPSKEKAMTMREVFEECQKGNYHHSKLLKRCRQIYDETDDKSDFNKEFIHYLKYAIIVMKREPAVERMLDFAAKFAVSFADESPESSRNESTISQDEGNEDSFLQFFFNFFLQSHGANYAAVRFRSCQMINKLLNSMGDDAQIDDNLFDKIYDNMLVRLRDKMAYVRVQAVTALARLQDPTDKNCPVIKAYMYMLNCDPNYEVRRTILNCIAPSAQTLPVVLKRTHDVKDDVRKLAFNVLAEKIHVKAMRISQRVELLQDGLNDRSELVKQTCATKLLQAWLRTFQGNVIDLLNCLDVESSSDVAEQALNSLFKSVPADELMSNFDLLNDKMVIDEDSLDCESALYWKCLCQHIKSLGDAGDEYLEKLLPTLSQFCDYVQSYMVKIKPSKNLDNVEETLRQEFIAQQLLILAGVLDLTDEVGRKRLDKLVHDMLVSPDISASLVKFLLERFNDLHSDVNSRITKVAEIISDVREPITVVETQENEKKKRQRDLKLAGVRVKLNQLKDDLENSVTKQEFAIAAEIKVEIAKLDEAKAKLLAEEEDSALIQEVRTEKNDPATLTKCLSIASEMLQELSTSSLNPVLRTLADTLIIPGIQNADPVVRNLAVKSLGLCCQLSKDFAKQYLLLLMQVSQVDQETIRVTAIQSIFDLLLLFGFNSFNTCDEDKSNESKDSNDDEEERDGNANNDDGDASQSDKDTSKDKEESNVAHSVLNIMTTLLDCESSEIRTVAAEGLCKLLLSGRIVSSKLISRLVILWYNPITEDDTRLRHCLGSFLPLYAFASRTHQECVGEAFLPNS
uniref:Condensin complex subunit 3-like n=1 Tax=Saccoglossus kowalevskii TaxID=10224 RepID=A0ABM0LZG5_SACKO|nr:PREDICTED: condensin complex subunit 3-like [Saccoglossus kowalevskii]